MRGLVDVSKDKSDAEVISLMMEFALFLSSRYKKSSIPNTYLAISCGNMMKYINILWDDGNDDFVVGVLHMVRLQLMQSLPVNSCVHSIQYPSR